MSFFCLNLSENSPDHGRVSCSNTRASDDDDDYDVDDDYDDDDDDDDDCLQC